MVEATSLRVALLARAGDARDLLRRAITELGAELVVESDPNELAPGALGAAGATTVLISVEPAVEAALDRLDAELLVPGLTVLYDEAETTAKLSGWDQARWARHLAAKLLGGDVLPPVVEEADLGAAELATFDAGGSFSCTVADTVDSEDLAMDPDLLRLAASFDENLELARPEPASDEFAADVALEFTGLDFSSPDGLSLLSLDDDPTSEPPVVGVASPIFDIGHLSLTPLDETGDAQVEAVGTVLILSGIGGPDAVRELLRALPAGFPLSVLLQQNLDGGRHDRFVEQLAKISRLPVALAKSQETPPPRAVRVLPEGLPGAGALAFPRAGGVAALIHAAAVGDGAVVVLSGADEAAIEPLLAALLAGVRVLVQDPATCFDAKVAAALRDAGAPALPAHALAARLDAHFSS